MLSNKYKTAALNRKVEQIVYFVPNGKINDATRWGEAIVLEGRTIIPRGMTVENCCEN